MTFLGTVLGHKFPHTLLASQPGLAALERFLAIKWLMFTKMCFLSLEDWVRRFSTKRDNGLSAVGPSGCSQSRQVHETREGDAQSVRQFSHSVQSNSLQPHGLQHTRPLCPSPTPGAYSNSCPLSRWWHLTISPYVVPLSSCLQYFPGSGSFPMSQLFTSSGQSIGVLASTSVLPMNIQDWFPLGWTGWISLQSNRLSIVFSNTGIQKHQHFGAQLSL